MQALGQRLELVELLLMVKQVSEDQSYNTIEFNEFLQMMSKQMHKNIAPKDLIEAFRWESSGGRRSIKYQFLKGFLIKTILG